MLLKQPQESAQRVVAVADGEDMEAHGSTAARRSRAILQYLLTTSKPMKSRPNRLAATSVEPLPANGSRTVPPGGQNVGIRCSAKATGKRAG